MRVLSTYSRLGLVFVQLVTVEVVVVKGLVVPVVNDETVGNVG